MKLGYIGLGKMGANMCERLLQQRYSLVVYDSNKNVVKKLVRKGAVDAASLTDLARKLSGPRVIWMMVPYGQIDSVLRSLTPRLRRGDIVIDGANAPYEKTIQRARALKRKGVTYLDTGISGGPSGARDGACVMVGGNKNAYNKLERLFRDVAVKDGYAYVGLSGAGHFVKMVHNGIEYGMMQSLAEGFALLRKSPFKLDLLEIAKLYNRRSVIESRLVGWLAGTYQAYGQDLKKLNGSVAHTGEGAWTVEAGKKLKSPTPSIELALNFRKKSAHNPSYAGKILSGLRNAFGGHSAKKK